MTNKAIIANGHQFANERVRLYFTIASDANILLNFYKWANKCVASYGTAVNIYGLNYSYVIAKIYVDDAYRFTIEFHTGY